MEFTDEDLKRLQSHIETCGDDCQRCCEMKLKALLARLECAETQRDVFKEMYERQAFRLKAAEKMIEPPSAYGNDPDYKARRKAKGE